MFHKRSAKAPVKIAIIGGTGLDDPDLLTDPYEKTVDTPYGKPSDSLIIGKIKNVDCVLLARHGRSHSISPTNINYQANIWALREEGCTHVLVTTACGSLREDYRPGDIVFLDQFIDRTCRRVSTFYDGSANAPKGVCHIPMHTPFCTGTRKLLIECAEELGVKHHKQGTNLTIEGPRFSSRAESRLWKAWGADVVNMTTVPEVVLAKESGMCYAAIALVTDYDSWRDDTDEHVCIAAAIKTFKENAQRAKAILLAAIPRIDEADWSTVLTNYQEEAENAVMGKL